MADIAIFDIFSWNGIFSRNFIIPIQIKSIWLWFYVHLWKKLIQYWLQGPITKSCLVPIFFLYFLRISLTSQSAQKDSIKKLFGTDYHQCQVKVSWKYQKGLILAALLTLNLLKMPNFHFYKTIFNMRDSDSCAMEKIPLRPIV